jgi:ABC-type multidrug transport system fused ATPase/permease subunit
MYTSETVNSSFYTLFLKLLKLLSPVRIRELKLLLVFMIFSSILEVMSIIIVVPFLNALTNSNSILNDDSFSSILFFFGIDSSKELILFFTFIFSSIVLFTGLFRFKLLQFQAKFSYNVGSEFSVEIYKRTLYQSYESHISRNSSEIISGIVNKANGVISNVLLPVLIIFSSGMMLVMVISALLYIDPVVAISSFFGFGLTYLIIMKVFSKILSEKGKQLSDESNKVVKALQEGLGGIRDILIDSSQKTYIDIYTNADKPLRSAQATIFVISNSPRFWVEAIGMTLIALLAYFISNKDGGISSSIPVIGALVLGAQRLLPVMQQGYSSWAQIKGAQGFLKDTLELLEQDYLIPPSKNDSLNLKFSDNITLKDISFSYQGTENPVLKGINFKINKGDRIGLIGSTGCGKSTLLDLIMGLLLPSQGKLLVDDVEITKGNINSWQSHIAHVPQSIFLADSTIIENIAFGIEKDKIDRDKVISSSQKAEIADSIESWPLGYNSLIGERGVRLSGGQRQRIGIARALYKNADLIVLDEATSALDNFTENEITKSIDKLDKNLTIIMVAHRITTLKNCNRIFKLENGLISKEMKYNDLNVTELI